MRGMSCQVENHALNLGSEDKKILKMFATWATQVYLPMFYEIKVKHEIKYGPWHLVKLFRLWNQQDETIKDVSNQYQKKESWWAHSENTLVALLSSDATDESIFAVDTIP